MAPQLSGRQKYVVAKSPIHGKGLFSLVFFKKGEVLGKFEGSPAKSDGMHVIYLPCDRKPRWNGLTEKESGIWWKALRIENELKYVNHSFAPNCEAIGRKLVALRNITPGEELTIHYGEAWNED